MAKAGGFFFVVFGVIVRRSRPRHDQPDLGLRAVHPGPDHRRLAARLVHRLPRRRAAPDAQHGDRSQFGSHAEPEHPHPGADPARAPVHSSALYPFIERLVDRGQPRAPPARPAAQRPDPHRARRQRSRFYIVLMIGGGNDIIAYQLRPVDQHDDPGPCRWPGLRRAADRLRRHQADLPRRCSAVTATSCCTAGRPAGSCGCRAVSSSRSTNPSTTRNGPSCWPTTSTRCMSYHRPRTRTVSRPRAVARSAGSGPGCPAPTTATSFTRRPRPSSTPPPTTTPRSRRPNTIRLSQRELETTD